MSLPILNTNSITVSAPAGIAIPAAGFVTYFWNTLDSNRLYYKDSSDVSHLALEDECDCIPECVCDIMKIFATQLNEALTAGTLTYADWQAAMLAGVKFVADGKTYTLSDDTP